MNTNPVIRVKRSLVEGKVPTIGQLGLGEVAINHYDGKLFIRQDTQGVGIGTTVVAIGLQGPQGTQGVGIATAGGTVGTGVTLLDFRGAGISTVTVSSGIGTININGGGSATPDISPVMMGMIF
jgi:hypothetical protein